MIQSTELLSTSLHKGLRPPISNAPAALDCLGTYIDHEELELHNVSSILVLF